MAIDAPLWLRVVLAALATWRVSVALYDGDFFGPLRYRAGAYLGDGERGFWGEQLHCFWCTCNWAALPCLLLALLPPPCWWLLLWPALSGVALLLSHGGRIVWTIMRDSGNDA
jgi:hypothetical protein